MKLDWTLSVGNLITPLVIVVGGVFAWFRYIKKATTTLDNLNATLGNFPLHKHLDGRVIYPDGKMEKLITR